MSELKVCTEQNSLEQNKPFIEILSVKAAACFLGISTKTVYKQAMLGVLPHRRIGNRYLFLRSELVRFLKGD